MNQVTSRLVLVSLTETPLFYLLTMHFYSTFLGLAKNFFIISPFSLAYFFLATTKYENNPGPFFGSPLFFALEMCVENFDFFSP